MRHFVWYVWKEHKVIGLLTVAATGVFLFFAGHFVAGAIHFANPANQNRPVEPWMSIRYVEKSWGLPKPVMFGIIGYDPQTPHSAVPRSVGDYLAESGQTLSAFQSAVEAAQQTLQEQHNP